MWLVFFFFSSRRRHTRLQGDWSSDVCSSDLIDACDETRGGIGRQEQRDVPPRVGELGRMAVAVVRDRKSTRLNSSHLVISYAVFCLKKKKKTTHTAGLL